MAVLCWRINADLGLTFFILSRMTSSKEPPSPGQSSYLVYNKHQNWAQITLNRPDKLNALNHKLREELVASLNSAAEDPEVHAILLTGSGRAFCSGMNLKEFPKDEGVKKNGESLNVFSTLETFPKPVIGAINGYAITGGFELALCCDILLASTEAKFADTHAVLGVIPGAGLSQKLSRLLGLHKAMSMHLTGEFLSAEEALRHGLVSHVLDANDLLSFAQEMTQQIAALDPQISKDIKKLVYEGHRMNLSQGMSLEKETFGRWANSGKRKNVSERRESVMQNNRDVSSNKDTS